MAVTLSHRGICVSDLSASVRFYTEALDFVPTIDYGTMGGPQMEQTTDIPGIRLHASMYQHPDGPKIELLHFEAPDAFGPRERRSTLQYGLVHLSFYVDDIDASAARIAAAGGHVFEQTRAHYPAGRTTMLYCTDPDGVRIELMHSEGVPARFSHSGICVDSIEASLPYFQALGFEPAENYVLDEGSEWLATVNEVDGIRLRAQMVRDKEANVIELLKVFDPPCFGPRERRALNQLGLTHLAFWVDDIDAIAAELAARGGSWAEQTRVVMPGIELYHGADPDGVRIELMRATG